VREAPFASRSPDALLKNQLHTWDAPMRGTHACAPRKSWVPLAPQLGFCLKSKTRLWSHTDTSFCS